MRVELKKLHERLGTTAIYVTHDQVEAMTLGDRVVVMRDGWVQQVGDPMELYNEPANRFVAGFIGSPAMNFAPVPDRRRERRTMGDRRRHPPQGAGADARTGSARYAGKEVTFGIRPEDLQIASDADPVELTLDAVVEVVERLGSEILLDVAVGPTRWWPRSSRPSPPRCTTSSASRQPAPHAFLRQRNRKRDLTAIAQSLAGLDPEFPAWGHHSFGRRGQRVGGRQRAEIERAVGFDPVAARQLRGIPAAAQRLDQRDGGDQPALAEIERGLGIGERRRLRDDDIGVGDRAGLVLVEEDALGLARRGHRGVLRRLLLARMRSAASWSSTCWNAVSTVWR